MHVRVGRGLAVAFPRGVHRLRKSPQRPPNRAAAGVATGTQLVLWGDCLRPFFGTHRVREAESFGLLGLPSLVSIGPIPGDGEADMLHFFRCHRLVHQS
jgi:hypothetical protein